MLMPHIYMGQIFVEGHSFIKMVIIFLILKAHYSFVFHSRGTDFAFLGLSWDGHSKNIRHHLYFLFHSPLWRIENPVNLKLQICTMPSILLIGTWNFLCTLLISKWTCKYSIFASRYHQIAIYCKNVQNKKGFVF